MSIDASILFCDDVREEVGNKSSYMGVYGPVMQVAEGADYLPRLCVCLIAIILDQEHVKIKANISANRALELPPMFEIESANPNPQDNVWTLKLNMIIANLKIPSDVVLTCEAEISGVALKKSIELRYAETTL